MRGGATEDPARLFGHSPVARIYRRFLAKASVTMFAVIIISAS